MTSARVCTRVALCLGLSAGPAWAQQATTPQPAPTDPATRGFVVTVRDLTRAESWRYFEPKPGGGDPDYAYLANRLQIEVKRAWTRVELTVTAQHVGFISLPDDASGPGPLGLGSLYYDQGGQRVNPQQLYPRYANVKVKHVLPGLDVQVGRMSYTSGAEAPTGDARIESLKRQRLDARIVGEFEWSIYQRGYDGVRADWTRGSVRATGLAVRPTQGGFARVAGPTIDDIGVYGGTVSVQPSPRLRHTQLQAFVLRYDDDRQVTQRPDNMGIGAARVDVGITSAGGTLVGVYPVAGGHADVLAWGVLQRGHWYEQRHRAGSVAFEAGYQWSGVRGTPWLRAGLLHASGDDAPTDGEHGTYFPVLPTVRRFSQTTAFSIMNVDDAFVQVMARPHRRLNVRVDVHRVHLASAADLWYTGSGATLDAGSTFGYAGRGSNGSRVLGTSIETGVDVVLSPIWSVNVFGGHINGGRAVTGTFAGDRFWFFYAEQVLRLDNLLRRR